MFDDKQILDRDKVDAFISQKLQSPLSLLRDLVDYGVGRIHKCAQQGGALSDLVIMGHFFKHSVMMLDAVEILLSRGAVAAAGVSARSMLEAYIYLEWLIQGDTENRARHFHVWSLRQKREWARRVIPGTDENQRFLSHLSTLSDMQDPAKKATIEAEGRKQDADLTTILTNAQNNAINVEFDRLKKRNFDVNWYKPTGAQSIGDMAKKLLLEDVYDFFYSKFSETTHVTDFEGHIKIDGKGGVIFEPLRSPENYHIVTTTASMLALRIYRLIMHKYYPTEEQNLNVEYASKWRNRLLSMPIVEVTDTSQK